MEEPWNNGKEYWQGLEGAARSEIDMGKNKWKPTEPMSELTYEIPERINMDVEMFSPAIRLL